MPRARQIRSDATEGQPTVTLQLEPIAQQHNGLELESKTEVLECRHLARLFDSLWLACSSTLLTSGSRLPG